MNINMKCPKCGYDPSVSNSSLRQWSREELRYRELRYMISNKSCKYAGLLRYEHDELERDLREDIDNGYIERREDGFYPTEKAKSFVKAKSHIYDRS